MSTSINNTARFVIDTHKGQFDKAGVPYFYHPISVAANVAKNYPETGDDGQLIALLHDVVEDTDYTLEDLTRMEYSDYVVSGVDLVSRQEGMTYKDFIRRLYNSDHETAKRVKIEDIKHNLSRITPALKGLEKRYNWALDMLI